MRSVALKFVGGSWDGKTLRTDSSDREEALLAAACYESSHHGAIGEACAALSEYAARFSRIHGWAASKGGSWQGADRYQVTEHCETEKQIVVKLTHLTVENSSAPKGAIPEIRDAGHENRRIPAGSKS
jgi:hypothetical protein